MDIEKRQKIPGPDQKELEEKIKSHGLWIITDGIEGEQLTLYFEILDGLDFSKKILSRACIVNCSAANTNFMGALLARADLSESTFIGANFQHADLSGCNFTDVRASCANFAMARFCTARLERANFDGANMVMADLRMTWAEGATFHGANTSEMLDAGMAIF